MDARGALLSVMDESELEEAVKEKIGKFHGFLTREVALKLIAKEKGLLKEEEKVIKLKEMSPDIKKAILIVTVERIYPVAKYKTGKESRRILVKDDSGEKTLVLWNDDIDLTLKMRTGDEIEIGGAYEKDGEIYLGYSGILKTRKKAEFTDIRAVAGKEGEKVHLRGFVSRISGFSKGIFAFSVSDWKNEIECRITGDTFRGNVLKIGDEVILEGGIVRNGKMEVGAHSRILARRKERMLMGRINKIECSGETLKAVVGKEKVLFDRENALRFMGVNAANDIMLGTIVTLKKDGLLNKNINVKVTRKNERIIIG